MYCSLHESGMGIVTQLPQKHTPNDQTPTTLHETLAIAYRFV